MAKSWLATFMALGFLALIEMAQANEPFIVANYHMLPPDIIDQQSRRGMSYDIVTLLNPESSVDRLR